MSDRCPRCEEYAESGKSFCGACGRYLKEHGTEEAYSAGVQNAQAAQPENAQGGFSYLILLAACVFIIFIAVFEAFVMLLHIGDVFGFLSDRVFGFVVLIPFPTVIFYLEGAMLQAYWVVLVIVILLCAVLATYKFIKTIRAPPAKLDQAEDTAFFWVGALFAAYLFITTVITLFFISDEITVPDFGDKLSQLFLFADAAVWEEIVTRLLLIGVPITLISLAVTKKKESLKCLLGGFGMSTVAVVLMIVSGAIFGMAHYSGWDGQVWKVLTTGIMGVFLGYLFIRFGLYAAILMHFIVDYSSAFDWIGIGWFWIISFLVIVGLGAIAMYYILKRLIGSKEAIDSLPMFRNKYIKE